MWCGGSVARARARPPPKGSRRAQSALGVLKGLVRRLLSAQGVGAQTLVSADTICVSSRPCHHGQGEQEDGGGRNHITQGGGRYSAKKGSGFRF